MIYLDNAATTWPKPETVYAAVNNCLRTVAGNPGRGGYSDARSATGILYEAREELAELFNCPVATNIVFTLNATDAMNTALLGMFNPGDHLVTSSMEHNAVARPLRYLESNGVKITVIPTASNGIIDRVTLQEVLQDNVTAVVLNHASNVTGAIMPVAEIGRMTKRAGCIFIVDAAQTAGVEHIDVQDSNIDVLVFSGHKGLFGPQGTGGMYVREGLAIRPLRYGGTGSLSEHDLQPDFMPDRLESGTPNTPGIAGLMAGVKFIKEVGLDNIRQAELALTLQLIDGLKNIAGITVYRPKTNLDHTAVVSFSINKLDCGEVAFKLDKEFNIACRAGLHCAPWAHEALGTKMTGTIRFSPGYFTKPADIEQVISAVKMIVEKGE